MDLGLLLVGLFVGLLLRPFLDAYLLWRVEKRAEAFRRPSTVHTRPPDRGAVVPPWR